MAKKPTEKNGRTADGKFAKGHTNGFQPGVSPNPGGRPKSRNYAAAARKWLDENADELIEKHGAAALGKSPDLAAARLIIEYAEGKPKQSVDLAINDPRALFDAAVSALVEKQNITHDEATAVMLDVMPEAREWIN